MASPTAPHDDSGRSLGLGSLLETIQRRRFLALLPFVFVLAAAVSLALFLPGLWNARAVILVDRQEIPESYVKSTVNSDIEGRLLTLSYDILSGPRLLKIAESYNLYPGLRDRRSAEQVVDRMRRDIHVQLPDADRRNRDATSLAFTVSYSATDPRVATAVTNTLANVFVQENVRYRERQAASTSEFLEGQLGELRGRLQTQERRIAEFKERYNGELPEQRDENTRTLERLQQQLQFASENNRRANERRQLITQTLAQLDPSSFEGTGVGDGPPPNATAARLSLLRQELAEMQKRYSDRYPDVVQLKEQIKGLEGKLASEHAAASPAAKPARRDYKVIPRNAYVQSMMRELDQANIDARTTADDITGLNRQIALYQRRLDNTPRREQELTQLTRDYETTRDMFRSLLSKRGEAGIASDLERGQKGERFRVIDPARIPERPAGPNRLRLLLVGLALAVGSSILAVVIAENVDTSYRAPDDVRATVPVPVLATIPRIETERDRRKATRQARLATAAAAAGLCLVVGATFVVAHNNQSLVSLMTSADTAAKR